MKNIAAKCLLFFIIGWTGSFSGKPRGCKKPTGYIGQLAECNPNRKWTPVVGETVKDIVEKNNALLKELIERTGPSDDCDVIAFGQEWLENEPCAGMRGVYHVLTNEADHLNTATCTSNYWMARLGKTGLFARLFLFLGGLKEVTGFKIKNTHNAGGNNMGTKDYSIYTGPTQAGPWTFAVNGTLPDPRNVVNVPVQTVSLSQPISTKFIAFEINSYYGTYCGGLQYFAALY